MLPLDRGEVDRRRDLRAVVAALAAPLCTGVRVRMIVVMVATAWRRRRWRAALELDVIPAVVSAVWSVFEGRGNIGQQNLEDLAGCGFSAS